MRNNTFQLDRFSKLIARTIKQNKKIGLISILVFAGIPLLLFLFNMINLQPTSFITRGVFLKLLVTFTFVLSPFIYFYGVNHSKKGLSEVMLPASILEKYTNMMLFCMIVVPLAAFSLYGVMDSLIALIFPKYFSGYAITEFKTIFIDWEKLLKLNLFMQSIFFFNLFFSSRKILKTIGAYMVLGIATTLLFSIAVVIADKTGVFESLTRSEITVYNQADRGLFGINMNDNFLIIFIQLKRIFLNIVLPLGLMIASYFVLKNKRY